MASARVPIVALAYSHSVTGTVVLRDQRLSDMLNDRRDSVVQLLDAVVAGHASSRKIEESSAAVLSKDHILILFEQEDAPSAAAKHPYTFTVKQRYEVFLIVDNIEVRGTMFSRGNLDVVDLHRFIATSGDRFVPLTEASVTLPGGPTFRKKSGVLVNASHINYIARAPVESTVPG